ncbi:hypothetical protein NB311A_04469 [Nitrobacter sp. Nb-311A]|uniref:AbiU2 domain-containing protein n=1 Tax=Nitrobacter sp. Nb-311A TaxID=314253 RepID=UPI0000686457|nr:hypothetical protein [Nitrobacter sp. Nb-311A]EAQ37535.1 hypothetical protein NB311A_04469 [Nitrobacter sp. Nb-311A]
MSYQTAAQAKEKYTAKMGDKLGPQFHELRQEVIYLNRKWMEYITLFGTKPTRVQLMNATAPVFFRTVQDVFYDDMLLHIARLTDPSQMGKFSNLTFQNLSDLINDEKLKAKVDPLLKSALEQSEFCRDWRNKLVAHRDLDVAINGTADQINGGTREQVNKIIATLSEILNAIELHLTEGSTHYTFDGHTGGAKDLLFFLDDGKRRHDERRARIVSNKATPDDLAARDV